MFKDFDDLIWVNDCPVASILYTSSNVLPFKSTIFAGFNGKALQALTINPLVTSGAVAKTILDEIIRENWDYLPKFHDSIDKFKY